MAINFPSNPTNAQEVTEGNVTYVYNATKGYWESSEGSSGASITVYADMTTLIAATGMSNGDQAFVTANNNLYIYSGSGWYKIATVQNDSPSAITGVDGSYALAVDGTPTVITAASTDPEGFPLTWSFSTSGLGSIATVSQVDNVFTITPSTNSANAGTFNLTINATDGVNGAVNANTSITLQFQILNSNYTTLLTTAVDTSTNSVITDASASSHTINVFGPDVGTFSPYRHGGYSYEVTTTGDYIAIDSGYLTTNTTWWKTSGFTMEGWVYFNNLSASSIIDTRVSGASGFMINIGTQAAGQFAIYSNSAWRGTFTDTTFNTGQWYYLVFQFSGTSANLYVNGVLDSTTVTVPDTSTHDYFGQNTHTLGGVQYTPRGANSLDGFYYDWKFTAGTVYSSNFTPPTESIESDANTALYIKSDTAVLRDASSNGSEVTSVGGKTSSFTPYDNSPYSAANNGGSIYFDGSDYCTISDSEDFEFGSGDFTVECWVYMTAYEGTGFQMFLHKGGNNSNAWHFDYKNGTTELRFLPYVSNVNASITATTTLNLNQWYHVAAVRNGNTIVLYKNGKAVSSTAYSLTIDNTADAIHIGQRAHLNDRRLTGYLSDIRINKSAVYTSDFTVPTSPVSSSGSTLHIKGTDASIIDKSQNTNLQLVGNTTGSTTEVKFADTKSMYFDGTGDYLQTSASTDYDLPTDFTIEAWIYPTALSSNRLIVDTYNASQAGSYQLYWRSTGGSLAFYTQADGVVLQDSSGSNIQVNTWHHVAVARSGSTFSMFVDGTQVNSTILTRDLTHGIPVAIGYQQATGTNYFAGYMQDVRITKGLSRYPYIPVKETLTSGTLTKALACHAASETTAVYGASSTSLSVTKNGTPTASDFGPAAGMKSVYFDGNDDWLTIDLGSAIGTNDFCVEGWAYRDTSSGTANSRGVFSISDDTNGWSSSGSNISLQYRNSTNGNEWAAFLANGQRNITDTDTEMGQWYHFVVQRNGGTSYVFIDGMMIYSIADTYDYSGKQYLAIGTYHSDDDWYGYISNLRVSVGSGSNFYAKSFTPPTAPLKG